MNYKKYLLSSLSIFCLTTASYATVCDQFPVDPNGKKWVHTYLQEEDCDGSQLVPLPAGMLDFVTTSRSDLDPSTGNITIGGYMVDLKTKTQHPFRMTCNASSSYAPNTAQLSRFTIAQDQDILQGCFNGGVAYDPSKGYLIAMNCYSNCGAHPSSPDAGQTSLIAITK